MKKLYLIILLSITGLIHGNGQTITNVGTDFWIAFQPNWNSNPAVLQLFISSTFSTHGYVYSAYPGINQNFNVVPGTVTTLTLPSGAMINGGIVEDKGIRITSEDPITVYSLNRFGASTDAFLALPVNALGTDYRVAAYTVSVASNTSRFSVVATEDNTLVTIHNTWTDRDTSLTLNQGQTFMNSDPNGGNMDITGSRIQSDHPVAVFGSNDCVYVPEFSCQACDHIVEEMFPYYSWGKNYVTVPLAGRDNSGDVFRILAANDGTDILVNGTLATTINTGEYYQTILTGSNAITGSKPIMVAQYAKGNECSGLGTTGDPLMMLIPPREQFLTNYTFYSLWGFYMNWVNVVAPDYALGTIYQDGVLIPTSAFTQISTTNYWGAQRSVTWGSHNFNSVFPFGVFVYGFDAADSYGYPGGCSLAEVARVASIILTPDTSYGQLNVSTVCLTANVLDSLSNPVYGVLVNFYVTGIKPLNGFAYSDSSGNAVFCYSQSGVIPQTDHVYAETFGLTSDTSTVFWTTLSPCVNPTNGGLIGVNQSGCGSYNPDTLRNFSLPAGQTGTLEYLWQHSIVGSTSGFTDIPGTNSEYCVPGSITQTTWFRRLARVDCKNSWDSAAISNVIILLVDSIVPAGVSITSSTNPVCSGDTVFFTAVPVNGGASPVYQWKVNGINAGLNDPVFAYPPVNADMVSCILTSSDTCSTGNPATSNPVTMNVIPRDSVSVSISVNTDTVCAGTSVTFWATLVNGGSAPNYIWMVNGSGTGSNSSTLTFIPADGDCVSCILTSGLGCTSGNPAISNVICLKVNPMLQPGISVSASQNPACQGTPVIFSATPTFGGLTPQYQWKVNGVSVGANNPLYNYIPVNGDLVNCTMTSGETCTTNNPVISNSLLMVIDSNYVIDCSITASQNPICSGLPVTITAHPVNGGSSPAFQWKVNGATAGSNNPVFTFVPANGDLVSCTMTSSETCTSNNPITTNTLSITTISSPVVTFTPCFDTITTTNAKPIRLKGGIPLGGVYSCGGCSGGFMNPPYVGVGTHIITYAYTNAALCSASAGARIHVFNTAPFNCGSTLTDIRDGQTYPTIQIGPQCWMAANLNFGIPVPSTQYQRDNCLSEKYCYQDLSAECAVRGAMYQWDELMRFDDTPGLQGLCPPGWHVPAEADWNTLFSNWGSNGYAGSPLKYDGYSGFNALLAGVNHQNRQWDFADFATLFWSSTSHGPDKAWSHGLNEYNHSVSFYPSLRSNAFSVRCLKD
jgi:uncharacterized protein (TIGR02145 family)